MCQPLESNHPGIHTHTHYEFVVIRYSLELLEWSTHTITGIGVEKNKLMNPSSMVKSPLTSQSAASTRFIVRAVAESFARGIIARRRRLCHAGGTNGSVRFV